jgi:hypothetical protein
VVTAMRMVHPGRVIYPVGDPKKLNEVVGAKIKGVFGPE